MRQECSRRHRDLLLYSRDIVLGAFSAQWKGNGYDSPHVGECSSIIIHFSDAVSVLSLTQSLWIFARMRTLLSSRVILCRSREWNVGKDRSSRFVFRWPGRVVAFRGWVVGSIFISCQVAHCLSASGSGSTHTGNTTRRCRSIVPACFHGRKHAAHRRFDGGSAILS